jgi:hypothetical protein
MNARSSRMMLTFFFLNTIKKIFCELKWACRSSYYQSHMNPNLLCYIGPVSLHAVIKEHQYFFYGVKEEKCQHHPA